MTPKRTPETTTYLLGIRSSYSVSDAQRPQPPARGCEGEKTCDASRASGWAAWLNGSKYCSANGLRKLNRGEKSLGVEVVLARLVDDPNLSVFGCIRIWKSLIDLSAFQ